MLEILGDGPSEIIVRLIVGSICPLAFEIVAKDVMGLLPYDISEQDVNLRRFGPTLRGRYLVKNRSIQGNAPYWDIPLSPPPFSPWSQPGSLKFRQAAVANGLAQPNR